MSTLHITMHHRWIKTLRGHIHYVSLCTQL